MSSIRSKPALMLGCGLLLAYMLVTRLSLMIDVGSSQVLKLALEFLRPGYRQHPVHALAVEAGTLLTGILALILLGVAVANGGMRVRLVAAAMRWRQIDWRSVIWSYLLGACLIGLLGFVLLVTGASALRDQGSGLKQAMGLLRYVLPLVTCYCAARLLFGRESWHADKWIGYVGAAAALFAIAWTSIGIVGLGDFIRFLDVSSGAVPILSTLTYLAISGLMVWTCLTLARKGKGAMIGAPRVMAMIYPIAGGIVLSGVLPKIGGFEFMLRSLPPGYLLFHVAMVLVTAFTVLLCIVDGARILSPERGALAAPQTDEVRPQQGLLRRMRAGLGARRFWIDLGLGTLITLVLTGIALLLLNQIPLMVAPFLLPLIALGFLIGPIIVFVIGVLRVRPGFAAAPVIIMLAVFGIRYIGLQAASYRAEAATTEAATLNVYPFAEPSRKHDVVVIEGGYDNRPDGECQAICRQILLSSDYAVAFAEQESGQWRFYRRASGDDFCRQPDQVKSYVEMIGNRRLDTCLTMSREALRPNGLVIREDYAIDLPIKKLLPAGVRASVTEFYERLDGQDRLLGRIVSGNVQPPLLSNQEPTKTPIQLSGAAFYAAALKLPIGDATPRGDADPAAVLAQLESLFADPNVGGNARDYFRLFGGKTEAEVAPKRAAILRFWQTNDPQLIRLGLAALYHIRNLGLDFAKPAVAQFLGSDDSTTMKAAVSALYAFDQDLEFAKVPLADLILSDRITAYDDDHLDSVTNVLKSVPGGFATDARARAKAQLDNNPDLAGRQLLAVLAIVARGSEQNRRETVEWILRNQGEDFERVMGAIGRNYKELGAPRTISFWSEEDMKQLVARGASVSDRGLIDYVRALQHQTNGYELRPQLRELLEQRADKLEEVAPGDKLAKSMRRAAKDVR